MEVTAELIYDDIIKIRKEIIRSSKDKSAPTENTLPQPERTYLTPHPHLHLAREALLLTSNALRSVRLYASSIYLAHQYITGKDDSFR